MNLTTNMCHKRIRIILKINALDALKVEKTIMHTCCFMKKLIQGIMVYILIVYQMEIL